MLGLPIVAATTARDSLWGPTIPELRAVLGDVEIHDRSTVSGSASMRLRDATA